MKNSNKFKLISLLLIVCILSFCLAACNKPSTENSNEPSTSVETNSQETNSQQPNSQEPTSQEPTSSVHTHSYTSSITKQATCVEKGVRTYVCSCNDSYTEDIPVLTTHTWDAGTVTLEPTCLEVGTKHFSCSVKGCQASKDEEIKATGHTLDNGQVLSEPDCKTGTAGQTKYSCTNPGCDHSETKDVAAKHNYGADNICTGCGDERTEIVLDISTLADGNITSGQYSEIFTFITESSYPFTVEATNKTAEDNTVFTKRLKTGGKSELAKNRRLISINASSAGTVSVYAVSGSTSASDATTRQVILYSVLGEIANSGNLDINVCRKYTMEIPKAGTYYIGCNAGVSIYQISFAPTGGSSAVIVEPFSFNATEYTLADPTIEEQVTSNLVINDKVSLFAKTDGVLKIKGTTKTSTDGKTFTQRITFNSKNKSISDGKGVIQFTIPAAGTVKIYVCSGSKTEDRNLCFTDGASFTQTIVASKDYDVNNPTTSGPEQITPYETTVPSAGDYYLYSTGGASGSSVYFYEFNYIPAQ